MKIKNVKIYDARYIDYTNSRSILYIPNGPTEINYTCIPGDWLHQLKTIFISDTIRFIDRYTFSDNEYYNVQNLILGKNVKEIGYKAFENSNIRKIVFPESIEYIDEYAFRYCRYLKSIDFSKAIKYEPAQPFIFDGCYRLKEMKLTNEIKNKIEQEPLESLAYSIFNVGHLKENYPEIFGD